LDSNIHGRNIEVLKHNLSHLFSIDFGIKRRLSQEDRVLIWRDSELNVESVVPYHLHIIPVLDDTMLDGVRDIENTSLLLSLITEVPAFALKSYKNLMNRSSDDRREDASGGFFF
jgi:hypothetical protein